MEFVLRCNDLKCRTQLQDRAVVTTCRFVVHRIHMGPLAEVSNIAMSFARDAQTRPAFQGLRMHIGHVQLVAHHFTTPTMWSLLD